ncbi:MAG: hypothetical protein LBJ62_08860 [Bifidobacteriaceae bacterium]|nr:hypothetical protein [Bifidobacteriaceae bacterium]
MWFWLWTGLIAAWLAAAFLLLRWLWRQAKGLMEALGAAAVMADELPGGAGFAGSVLPAVALSATAEELAERRDGRRGRIARRRALRQARHQAAYDSWAVLAGYKDG